MKRIFIVVFSLAIFGLIVACGDTNQDDSTKKDNNMGDQNTNPQHTNQYNSTDVQDDSGTNESSTDDQEYMKSKMDELNFKEIEVEVSYSENKEYTAEIEQEHNQPIEAKIENELNNEFITGKEAFDHLFSMAKKLSLSSDTSKPEVIDQLLNTFDLPTDYIEFEAEITFNDGKKLSIEDSPNE